MIDVNKEKRAWRAIALATVATMVLLPALSSCLGGEEYYTYSDDTAITSFTLGTLNRYLHTTSSSGEDSVYKKTFSGSL